MSTDTEAILSGVRTWAENNDVPVDSIEDAEIVVTLPGEKKLKTNVAISVFARTAHLQAFVIRHPDENSAAVQPVAAAEEPQTRAGGVCDRQPRRCLSACERAPRASAR
jgi:hypothetical protein